MKFVIFIPVKNEEKYIGRIISSILFQDVDFEIIVNVSPETTDNTLTIVKAYQSFLGDKLKIQFRKEGDHVHDACNEVIRTTDGDIFHAISAHTQYMEGALKYVEENINEVLFGAVLHEDLHVQFPTGPEDLSSYAMYLSVKFLRENNLDFDDRYPDIADYVLRKRIFMMGKGKVVNKVLNTCSPRPSQCETNGHIRSPQYAAFRKELQGN